MHRFLIPFLCFWLGLLLLFAPAAHAQQAEEYFLEERGLGDSKKPKLIIEEFASFTCPHCAEFHRAVFPHLKKKYIDSGKAYFIYTDFPWDDTALDAAVAARCMPKDKYFDFVSALYAKQQDWAFKGNPEQNLIKLAEAFGVAPAKTKECLDNESMKTSIVAKMQSSEKIHEISSTPSLILNGEEFVDGGMSVDEVIEAIDKYMADQP